MSSREQPNILIFFTDQQRWDTVGAYRSPLDLTPNLDAVAREGTVFEQAFTCQPVCGPARSCLQTGKYATQTGCWRNAIRLPSDELTIANVLSEAGYETGYLGKWHLGSRRINEPLPPDERGGWDQWWEVADVLEHASRPYAFRAWDAAGHEIRQRGYRVDAQTDRALGFLNLPHEAPWCLMISYLEPHHQNNLNRYVAPHGYAERYQDAWVPEDLRALPGDWPSQWADYCGIIKRLDENFGRLMNELDRLNQRDDTVVIFVTDHGSHFRTRNREYKRSCHEASIHIPLIIAGPGFDQGRRAPELASLIDVPPTICDLARGSVPDSMMGRSLRPLGTGPAAGWPDDVYIQISEASIGRAVRTERWKYCVTAPDNGQDGMSPVYDETHLYDLWADPHELVNLSGRPDYRAQADELKARVLSRMAEAGEPPAEIRNARFI